MSVNEGHNLGRDVSEDIPLPNDPPNNFAYDPWHSYYAWQMFYAITRFHQQPPPPPPQPQEEHGRAPPPPPGSDRGPTPPPPPEVDRVATPPPPPDRLFTPPPNNQNNGARVRPQDQRSMASTSFRNQQNESEYSWPSDAPSLASGSLASDHNFPQQQHDRQQPRQRQTGTFWQQHVDRRRFPGQRGGRNSNPRYDSYAPVNANDTDAEISKLRAKLVAERKKNRYLAGKVKDMQSKMELLQRMNTSSIMIPHSSKMS